MQDVMQSMSGMQWPHSRCASPSQALRCSGVPWAAAGMEASVNVHTTAQASRLGIRFRIGLCMGGRLTNRKRNAPVGLRLNQGKSRHSQLVPEAGIAKTCPSRPPGIFPTSPLPERRDQRAAPSIQVDRAAHASRSPSSKGTGSGGGGAVSAHSQDTAGSFRCAAPAWHPSKRPHLSK
jgi:hypothetical protein